MMTEPALAPASAPAVAPAARTYAHVVAGVVREVYVVPAVHASIPLAQLFPPGATWVSAPAYVGQGWLYDGTTFAAPPPPSPPAPPTSMTPLAFFARFTTAETATLYQAALASPEVLGFLMQASAAQTIDIADPRVRSGLDALVAAGLLTAARETEVLTP